MIKPPTTVAAPLSPPSEERQTALAKVPPSVDHPLDENEILKELSNMIALDNRNAVLALAKRLIGCPPAVVEQAATVEDKWMTPGEAALYANISRMTIWRWRNERGLPFTKVGAVVRIRSTVLQKFLEQHKSG
jgi:excisionase family DNA binding protein